MQIIDTHQHLWNLEKFPYTWCQNIPALNRSFSPSDYAEAAHGTGVTQTVFVECDVDDPHQLDEARYVESLADCGPRIAGIVAACRPEQEDFSDRVRTLNAIPLMKGLRRVLHVVPDGVSQSNLFVENIRRLEEYNLSFDLCVLARQLPLAIALVNKCPGVSFILDHCGVPDIKGKSFMHWKNLIEELAGHSNVVCKVSGLVTCAEPGKASVEELQPWVNQALESFGWDRVLWGGDWPVCTLSTTLADWMRTTQALVSHASVEQQESFFWRNATRVYRLN